MIPYFMAMIKRWKGNSYEYMIMNILGGLFMVKVFFARGDTVFLLLNLIWLVGGVVTLVRKYLRDEKE